MPHPLAIKYGSGDPALWDDEKRSKARTELHAILGSGRDGKKPLANTDRIELMRIWLAVIAAENGPRSKASASSKAIKTSAKSGFNLRWPVIPGLAFMRDSMRTLTIADYTFIVFLLCITGAVTALGVHAVQEVLRVEEVKKDAEDLALWFKKTGEDRKNVDFKPAACSKASTATWKDCIMAMTTEAGPLHGKTNAFQPGRALLSRKCDQQDTETIGAIIVEKGSLAPGASNYSYTALDGSEPVNKDMTLRIIVCGRGFHLIKVQNDVTW